MNDSDRQLLLAVSGLLHYPDDDFFVQARSFEELCDLLSVVRACPLREFIRSARSKGLSRLREEHVAIFDMDSKCSLSLAWHRYGDDPRLGRALAGLTGLGWCCSTGSARNLSAFMPCLRPGIPTVPMSLCSGRSSRFSALSRINAFPRSVWSKFRWRESIGGRGGNVFERRARPRGFPLSTFSPQSFWLMGELRRLVPVTAVPIYFAIYLDREEL